MFENTPMAIHDCGFTGLEPIDCYSKAISIADKNTAGLNRLAKVCISLVLLSIQGVFFNMTVAFRGINCYILKIFNHTTHHCLHKRRIYVR